LSEESLRFDMGVGAKESIAESNITEQIRGLIRNMSQAFRELLQQIKDLDEGKYELVKVRYERIRSVKNSIEDGCISLMEYVVRVSPALLLKDNYVSIINSLLRSAESCEAASYRALVLSNKKVKSVPDMLYALVESIIKNSINMLDFIDTMVTFLSVNPKKINEVYVEVVKLENVVDDFYRHAVIEVVKEFSGDVGSLVFFKELVDKLEDAVDHLKDAGTNVKYIALHRV